MSPNHVHAMSPRAEGPRIAQPGGARLFDMRHAPMLPSELRQRQSEWLKQHSPLLDSKVLGQALVITSPLLRHLPQGPATQRASEPPRALKGKKSRHSRTAPSLFLAPRDETSFHG